MGSATQDVLARCISGDAETGIQSYGENRVNGTALKCASRRGKVIIHKNNSMRQYATDILF